ncbi:MAG: phage major capsid protein [Acidimicrobiales bacterium]
MSDSEEALERAVAELTARIGKLADRVDDSGNDGGRKAAAADGLAELTAKVVALEGAREDKNAATAKATEQQRIDDIVADAVKAATKGIRAPSAVETIGQGKALTAQQSRMLQMSEVSASPMLKALFRDYRAGEFLTAILDTEGIGVKGIDLDRIANGKAALADLGLQWMGAADKASSYMIATGDIDPNDPTGGFAKATTGVTGATGGYVLPNNLVDTLVKPATQRAVLQTMVTVRNGVNVRGVDQPYRLGAPPRMTFQDWGVSKENLNETYGSYTANLGTIARVMDITKQYARFSAGSAEADVIDELTKAAILGENYYMIGGAGTGSVGVGDPTTGVYTALNASGVAAYKTAFSPVATTLAGSAASGFAQAIGALAARSREASGIVVDAVTYWTIVGQGTDTAGFWVEPENGPTGFSRTASGALAFWGVPMYWDANLSSESTTKIALLADWAELKLYRGMEFRIDTSDQAGTRWDQNLIGFRGEEEIGFNASTALGVGALQLVTGIIA